MPSKPAKYGIKSWVACDAKSSYAWNMQIYTGKSEAGPPEKNQGMRVVLDLTEGLACPRGVTCDNFFTSYELGQRLLERKLTMVGTVRKNRTELPPEMLDVKARPVFSSKFAFTDTAALLSYVPKKRRNVLLMSTLRPSAAAQVCEDRRDRKPAVVLHYNATKGGVDNLDKVVSTYSTRRMTARWPLVVFHNVIDVSAYNAFVLWREINPGWMSGKRNMRRVFLELLGKDLVRPRMERRRRLPRAEASASLVREARGLGPVRARHGEGDGEGEAGTRGRAGDRGDPGSDQKAVASKRKRCQICPPKKDSKTHAVCTRCTKYVCKQCALPFCPNCAGGLGRGNVR